MKKKSQKMLVIAAAALLCAGNVMPVQAGAWQQDGNGWWWQEEDGTYPSNEWRWIDSDGNGTAECYFSSVGYCLQDTVTPDGYFVNSSGEWVADGVVQQKAVEADVAKPEEAELSYERAKEKLLAYYNNQRADDGDYVVSDNESRITETGYHMVIRYQMSDAEAMELIKEGGMPTANGLVGMVVVNKKTGVAVFEDGEEILLK